jgi:halocyanin-like protein
MDISRRNFVRIAGVSTAVGVAGCTGNGGNGGDDTVPGEDYPAIDEWLTETEVGDADDTYEGTLLDRRDSDTLTIETGAAGNGGNFAYAPSAVLVSTGTEIEWSWTGEGNPHNVEAEPDDQIGESDYEFSSGEAVGGSGVQFTYTMDTAGIALYHCEPHLSLGMKGGIAVE